MNAKIRKFLTDESGVTALEYVMLAALIALVLAAGFQTSLNTAITSLFTTLTNAIAKL